MSSIASASPLGTHAAPSGRPQLDTNAKAKVNAFSKEIDDATKFIPLWVKVVVATALGLGTMVGWKRIVITVGEKIGKTHLTHAQGATLRNLALAWVLTMPAAIILSGSLYGLFSHVL